MNSKSCKRNLIVFSRNLESLYYNIYIFKIPHRVEENIIKRVLRISHAKLQNFHLHKFEDFLKQVGTTFRV